MSITKEEIKKIMSQKGKIRGEVFRTDTKFILRRESEEELRKIEERAKELGYPIPYQTAESLDWYPVGLRILSFLVIKEVLNWTDKDFIAMGYNAPKISFVVKLLTKHFLSFKKLLEHASDYWEKHYTIGRLEPYEIDMDNKRCLLRIYDFKAHPLLCTYWLGYFKRIGEFGGVTVKNIKLTKSIAKGDSYIELVAEWE